MCFQENFIKEMDTMKNFNKVAEKKFEHPANDFVILSRKNPASRRDDTKLAFELLKNKVLTLENQLTEKDALINVLYRKVDIAKNTFIKIDQVRFSESRTEMIISNSNNNNDNSNATVLNKSADVSSTFYKTCALLDNFTKRHKTLGKSMPDTNARLKNFYTKKGIGFIDNKNLKEAHLGKKKASFK